jgi:hypothetical protein
MIFYDYSGIYEGEFRENDVGDKKKWWNLSDVS